MRNTISISISNTHAAKNSRNTAKSKLNCLWKHLIEITITVYIYECPRGSHEQNSRSNQSIGRRSLAAFLTSVYERLQLSSPRHLPLQNRFILYFRRLQLNRASQYSGLSLRWHLESISSSGVQRVTLLVGTLLKLITNIYKSDWLLMWITDNDDILIHIFIY